MQGCLCKDVLHCLQVINIVTLGSPSGTGAFFPNGLVGNITKPTGYNVTASGLDSFPSSGAKVASQVCPPKNLSQEGIRPSAW